MCIGMVVDKFSYPNLQALHPLNANGQFKREIHAFKLSNPDSPSTLESEDIESVRVAVFHSSQGVEREMKDGETLEVPAIHTCYYNEETCDVDNGSKLYFDLQVPSYGEKQLDAIDLQLSRLKEIFYDVGPLSEEVEGESQLQASGFDIWGKYHSQNLVNLQTALEEINPDIDLEGFFRRMLSFTRRVRLVCCLGNDKLLEDLNSPFVSGQKIFSSYVKMIHDAFFEGFEILIPQEELFEPAPYEENKPLSIPEPSNEEQVSDKILEMSLFLAAQSPIVISLSSGMDGKEVLGKLNETAKDFPPYNGNVFKGFLLMGDK